MAADKAAEVAAVSEEVATMQERIQKTMQELQREAASADEDKASCEKESNKERDERLRVLFQVKLEAYQHMLGQLVPTLVEQATEMCVKREERVAAEEFRLNRKYFFTPAEKEMMASPAQPLQAFACRLVVRENSEYLRGYISRSPRPLRSPILSPWLHDHSLWMNWTGCSSAAALTTLGLRQPRHGR